MLGHPVTVNVLDMLRNVTVDRQTNRQNNTNLKRNLAMMVIYLLVKFEFDWTNRF